MKFLTFTLALALATASVASEETYGDEGERLLPETWRKKKKQGRRNKVVRRSSGGRFIVIKFDDC